MQYCYPRGGIRCTQNPGRHVRARQYPRDINVLHAIRRSPRLGETARSPILLLDRKGASPEEKTPEHWAGGVKNRGRINARDSVKPLWSATCGDQVNLNQMHAPRGVTAPRYFLPCISRVDERVPVELTNYLSDLAHTWGAPGEILCQAGLVQRKRPATHADGCEYASECSAYDLWRAVYWNGRPGLIPRSRPNLPWSSASYKHGCAHAEHQKLVTFSRRS